MPNMYKVETTLDSTTYLKADKPDLTKHEADIILRRTLGFAEDATEVRVRRIEKTKSRVSKSYDQILSVPATTIDGIRYYYQPGFTKRVIVITPRHNNEKTVYNVDIPSGILKNNNPEDVKTFLEYVANDFNRLHPDNAVANPAWYDAIRLPTSQLKLYGVEVEELTTNMILYQEEPAIESPAD